MSGFKSRRDITPTSLTGDPARFMNRATAGGAIESQNIADGAITDEQVADDAAITETKVDVSYLTSGENKNGSDLVMGQPVASYTSGTGFVAASALAVATQSFGLLNEDVAATISGTIRFIGLITLADWTAVIGAATLAPRTTYYLSETPGKLTATPPTSLGSVVQQVGVAVTPTTLDVAIKQSVLL